MNEEEPKSVPVSQRQFQELSAQVAAIRSELDALQVRADDSNHRAQASDNRAEAQDVRMDALEARVDVDQELISELQDDGVLNKDHAAHLEEALRTSRRIGAAMGIVMANHQLGEVAAFRVLSKASQDTNRKLRVLADDVVRTGDVSSLPDV